MSLTLLALLISGIALPSAWTQAFRVVRKQTIEGLSPTFLLLSLWSSLIWTSYGLITRLPLQILTNSSGLLATLTMMVIVCRSRAMSSWTAVGLSGAFIAGNAGLYVIGPQAIGTVAMAWRSVVAFRKS